MSSQGPSASAAGPHQQCRWECYSLVWSAASFSVPEPAPPSSTLSVSMAVRDPPSPLERAHICLMPPGPYSQQGTLQIPSKSKAWCTEAMTWMTSERKDSHAPQTALVGMCGGPLIPSSASVTSTVFWARVPPIKPATCRLPVSSVYVAREYRPGFCPVSRYGTPVSVQRHAT